MRKIVDPKFPLTVNGKCVLPDVYTLRHRVTQVNFINPDGIIPIVAIRATRFIPRSFLPFPPRLFMMLPPSFSGFELEQVYLAVHFSFEPPLNLHSSENNDN